MTEKLVRLRPPHATAEANIGGKFYLPHLDGFVYIEYSEDTRLHIEALTKVGGYARVGYPQFEHKVWVAIQALSDALDGAEQQTILDACECVLQSFEADVERLYPAT
jgi:hypothetical protein